MEKEVNAAKELILFPMELIDRFKWNSELGRRLKSYREGFSEERLTRKEMEQRLSSKGVKYGREAIKKLEEGFYGSVDRDVLLAIFQELQISPQIFFRAQGLYVISE